MCVVSAQNHLFQGGGQSEDIALGLYAQINALQAENQLLREENKRLKDLDNHATLVADDLADVAFEVDRFVHDIAPTTFQRRYHACFSFKEKMSLLIDILRQAVISNVELKNFLFARAPSHLAKTAGTASAKPHDDSASAGNASQDNAEPPKEAEPTPTNEREQAEASGASPAATCGAGPADSSEADTAAKCKTLIRLAKAVEGQASDTKFSDKLKAQAKQSKQRKPGSKHNNRAGLKVANEADVAAVHSATRQQRLIYCPLCHALTTYGMKQVAEAKKACEKLIASGIFDYSQTASCVTSTSDIMHCPNCGFNLKERPSVDPAFYGSSISLSTGLDIALARYYGLPVNRSQQCFLNAVQLGHSTLDDALCSMAMTAFLPIYLALSGYIDSQTAEHADEIHMKVIIGSEVLKMYVFSKCTGEISEPCIVFYGPTSRGAESIKAFLADMDADFLTVDGYSGYNLIFREKDVIRQNCLSHLVQKLDRKMEVLNCDLVAEATQNCSALLERLRSNQLDLNDTQTAIQAMIIGRDKLSTIFENERYAREMAAGDPTELIRWRETVRRESSAALFADVDTIFSALAECYCECKGSEYKSKRSSEPIGMFIAYYMNGREKFPTFLTNPQCDADNMLLERSNRVISRYRSTSLAMRSEKKSLDVSIMDSIIESARMNGIVNIKQYMLDAGGYMLYKGYQKIEEQAFKKFEAKLDAAGLGRTDENGRPLQMLRRSYSDKVAIELYSGLACPKWVLPWNWVKLFGPDGMRDVSAIPKELWEPVTFNYESLRQLLIAC